jgi:hypothetical protein
MVKNGNKMVKNGNKMVKKSILKLREDHFGGFWGVLGGFGGFWGYFWSLAGDFSEKERTFYEIFDIL